MTTKLSRAIKAMVTPGTPLCALCYALLGALLAALLLWIGFWKTLFIAAFAGAGAALGAIGNKKEAVRSTINRCFPPRDRPLTDAKGKTEDDSPDGQA